MKVLYVTPTIHDEGGVARVLSLKSNYLIENYGYDVSFVTVNNAGKSFFYNFNPKISVTDLALSGFKFFKILRYYTKLKKVIKKEKPDVIVVCDFGWKGFCFNLFLKTKIPVVFELHGSRFNETRSGYSKVSIHLRSMLRKALLKTFHNIVFLSEESRKEWGLAGFCIPNPLSGESHQTSHLENHKAITIARHSYEKGIDRLLPIWAKAIEKYPNWILEIYGEGIYFEQNVQQAKELNLDKNLFFYKPIKEINEKYRSSSLALMTSRQEGFPMFLLESMDYGLPVVAYDCPIGPKSLVVHQHNGFLIPDGDEAAFLETLLQLMSDVNLRKEIGGKAKKTVERYGIEKVVPIWNEIILSLVSKD